MQRCLCFPLRHPSPAVCWPSLGRGDTEVLRVGAAARCSPRAWLRDEPGGKCVYLKCQPLGTMAESCPHSHRPLLGQPEGFRGSKEEADQRTGCQWETRPGETWSPAGFTGSHPSLRADLCPTEGLVVGQGGWAALGSCSLVVGD